METTYAWPVTNPGKKLAPIGISSGYTRLSTSRIAQDTHLDLFWYFIPPKQYNTPVLGVGGRTALMNRRYVP